MMPAIKPFLLVRGSVWCAAPSPATLPPQKYSLNTRLSFHPASRCNRRRSHYAGRLARQMARLAIEAVRRPQATAPGLRTRARGER